MMAEVGTSLNTNAFGVLLLDVGFIIIITLFVAYFFRKIGIPAVMGILLGGILIGFNEGFKTFLLADNLESFRLLVTELAIGYIAYDIGNEIDIQVWKDRITKYLIIIIGETTIPFILVTGICTLFLDINFGLAMILGAIAMTTAPVITSEIMGDYHTDEDLNQLILFLLVFDSVIAILVINMAVAIVSVPNFSLSLIGTILIILFQKITISAVLSFLGALFILYMLNRRNLEERSLIEWLLGVSLVILGITLTLNGSVILTMLFFGIMLRTMESRYGILTEHVLQIEILLVPIVLMFFIIMGVSVDTSLILGSGLVLILAYFVLRLIGKLGGTFLITRGSKLPVNIKNNLHLFLTTQGGIAIALAGLSYNQLINLQLQTEATLVLTVITVAVIVSELIGPLLLRFGIYQSQNGKLQRLEN